MRVEQHLESSEPITLVQDILDATIVSILTASGLEHDQAKTLVAGVRAENKKKFSEKKNPPKRKIKGEVMKTVKVINPIPLKPEERLTDANTVSLVKTLEARVKKDSLLNI